MLPRRFLNRVQTALALIVLLALLAGSALGGEFQRQFQFDSEKLTVSNLIGQVGITGGSGDEFIVEVNVRGDHAKEGLLEFLVMFYIQVDR